MLLCNRFVWIAENLSGDFLDQQAAKRLVTSRLLDFDQQTSGVCWVLRFELICNFVDAVGEFVAAIAAGADPASDLDFYLFDCYCCFCGDVSLLTKQRVAM